MLNKNCIKTILNVKHTCIDKVTMLADTSIMIQVHATKCEQCRCGICGKNPSSMTMAMKVPEPGEPATGQVKKLFWLSLPAESTVRSMVSLHAAFLGPDMAPALHANLKNRLLGWLLTVLV